MRSLWNFQFLPADASARKRRAPSWKSSTWRKHRRQLEAQIVDEVKSALDELAAARNSVDVANLGLQLAEEEVAQAQRRFAAGVTTNVEVITAQDALARASDNQIGALYQFNLSRASLARATGEIEAMYTK